MQDGENMPNASKQTGRGWTILRAASETPGPERKRIVYVEAYGAGSHARIATLLQRYTRHALDIILLDRDHWRWLALTAHRLVSDAISSEQLSTPDALILSGPLDVAKLLAALPAAWRHVPCAVYFHESQWTYPGDGFDRRPYLVGHLEALEHCDRVWFNSRYHHDIFRDHALANRSSRVRRLACDIIAAHWHKVRVVYPPVQVGPSERHDDGRFRIAWAARWEPEKRPDLLVDAVLRCAGGGLEPVVHLLGASNLAERDDDPALRRISPFLSEPSGYPSRATYEKTLSLASVWVSTAEHEFFGIAALEAALAGATPILPWSLAYPETLPSAVFYPAGDVDALADRIAAIAHHRFGRVRPWAIDARRFEATIATTTFDHHCDELMSASLDGAQPRASCQPFASHSS